MDLSQPLEDGLSLDDDFPTFEDLPPEAEPLSGDDSMLDDLPPEFDGFPDDQEDLPEELEDLVAEPDDLPGLQEGFEEPLEDFESLDGQPGESDIPSGELDNLPDDFESLPEEFEISPDDFEALPEYIEDSEFDADGLDSSFEEELLPDVAGGLGDADLLPDTDETWLEPDTASAVPSPTRSPAKVPPVRKEKMNKEDEPKSGVDPFGEEAARLYRYLKDLSLSLPPEKKQAMEASGVSAKLDAIIEHSAGAKPQVVLPDEIFGVPVSPRLAKLIEFMRREKQHGGK